MRFRVLSVWMMPLPARVSCRLVFVFAVITVLAGSLARSQQQPRFAQIERDGRISWTSETNVSYQLQRVGQLGSGVWTNVGSPVTGDGGIVSVTDQSPGSAQVFYRVVATNSFSCTNGGGAICAAAVSLGSIAGDTNDCVIGPVVIGCGNAWFRIRLLETATASVGLRLDVALDSPPGVNYDLYLYESCASIPESSPRGAGQSESVFYTYADASGIDNSRNFWIEVRQAAGSPPGIWTLRTSGGRGPCY